MNRPANIVYLMFDQLKASATGLHGNPHAHTPFLDEMAAQGTAFMEAYASAPICTPSRASVMTGVHPLVHHVTCHQNRAPCNLPQLAELLTDAGYYTAATGHIEAARSLARGWHDMVPSDELGALQAAYAKRKKCGRADVGWSSGSVDCDADQAHAKIMTDRVCYQLDGIAAMDQPFFLHVAWEEPHAPYFAGPPYDTLIDPSTLPLPAQGDDATRPAWQHKVHEQQGAALAFEDDIKKAVAQYYGMTALVDDQMRRMRQELAKRGLLDNTWIIISSDHGDYTGEKRMFTKTETLYECLLHVPLVIIPPEGVDWKRGQRVDGLVDLVDLFPTILGMAGVDVPAYAQGYDLCAWTHQGAAQPLRDAVFSQVGEYHGSLKTTNPGGIPESGRHPGLLQGARNEAYSYINDPDYGDEAYDLGSDPLELNNLMREGADSLPAGVVELRERQAAWELQCLALRDELGVVPGYRGFDLEGKAEDLYMRR